MQIATLLSIQTGKPQRLTIPNNMGHAAGLPWETSFFRTPTSQPLWLYTTHLSGNEQADKKNHGQPDQAVLLYAASHYPLWRTELAQPAMGPGGFGENFTVRGFSDATVCIGDIWQVGDTLRLQVTQARQPCYKLARRLQQPHIVKRIHENSWGGWYLRVLVPGPAASGMPIERVERLHPEWTVAAAVQTLYAARRDREKAAALAALPELSARWKAHLTED